MPPCRAASCSAPPLPCWPGAPRPGPGRGGPAAPHDRALRPRRLGRCGRPDHRAGAGRGARPAVVVENRGGSGGVIGSEAALAAPADGDTIVFHTLSSAVLNAGLYRNLSFDVRRAFAPVALVGTLPNVVMVNPQRAGADPAGAAGADAARAGAASPMPPPAPGTITHLSAHLLASMAGAEATHVPYRGSGPAFADLLAGHGRHDGRHHGQRDPGRAGRPGPRARGHHARRAAPRCRRCRPRPRPGCRATRPTTGTPSSPMRRRRRRSWRGWKQATIAAVTAPGRHGWQRPGWSRGRRAARRSAPSGTQQMALWIPIIRASGATAD